MSEIRMRCPSPGDAGKTVQQEDGKLFMCVYCSYAMTKGDVVVITYDVSGSANNNPKAGLPAELDVGGEVAQLFGVCTKAIAAGAWQWLQVRGFCEVFVETTETDIVQGYYLRSVAGQEYLITHTESQTTRGPFDIAIAREAITADGPVLAECYLLGDRALVPPA